MKRGRTLLIFITLLVMVLGSTFFVLPIKASDDIDISLYNNHSTDNSSFTLSNMFPGDSETKKYNVKVSYHDKVKVIFNAKCVNDDNNNLANVMNIKISLNNNVLYEGLVKDLNDISYTLYSNNNKTEVLDYEITVSLDTSVNNDYQNKELKLDFIWSIDKEDTNNLVNTAYSSNMILWISLIILSLIFFIFLYRRNKSNVR